MRTVDRVDADPAVPDRRPATVAEARALAHPVRLRILRLLGETDLTNRELADVLGRDPATVLHHLRQLVAAGFVEPLDVRRGRRNARERPYRSTGRSWWLSAPEEETPAGPLSEGQRGATAALAALRDELDDAGGDAVVGMARFVLHLSPTDLARLDAELLEVLDRWQLGDAERRDQPAYGGFVLLHELRPGVGPGSPAPD